MSSVITYSTSVIRIFFNFGINHLYTEERSAVIQIHQNPKSVDHHSFSTQEDRKNGCNWLNLLI